MATGTGTFSIGRDTGVLAFKSAKDYEALSSYTFPGSIRATDNGSPAAASTRAVTATVTDAPERGTVTMSPSRPYVGDQVTATLTDPDRGVTGPTWSWRTEDSGSRSTSTQSYRYTVPSSAAGKILRASVSYSDVHGSQSADTTSTGTVRRRPCSLSLSASKASPVSYAENGTGAVATYTASASNCGSLTWSPVGVEDTDFQLRGSGSSRSLHFRNAPNYEAKSSYEVTVTVRSGSESASRTVTVNVTDVNEPPVISGPASPSVPENQHRGGHLHGHRPGEPLRPLGGGDGDRHVQHRPGHRRPGFQERQGLRGAEQLHLHRVDPGHRQRLAGGVVDPGRDRDGDQRRRAGHGDPVGQQPPRRRPAHGHPHRSGQGGHGTDLVLDLREARRPLFFGAVAALHRARGRLRPDPDGVGRLHRQPRPRQARLAHGLGGGPGAPRRTRRPTSTPPGATDRWALSWGPADGNGAPITGYGYRYRSDSGSWPASFTSISVRSKTIGSLDNGTLYHFQVEARNIGGASSPSEDSATPAGTPGAPQSLATDRQGGNGFMELSWEAASANGSAILHYYYRYKKTGDDDWRGWYRRTGGADARSKSWTNFDDGAAYVFQVRARNGVGYGSTAQVSASALGPGGSRGARGEHEETEDELMPEGEVPEPGEDDVVFFAKPVAEGPGVQWLAGTDSLAVRPGAESVQPGNHAALPVAGSRPGDPDRLQHGRPGRGRAGAR